MEVLFHLECVFPDVLDVLNLTVDELEWGVGHLGDLPEGVEFPLYGIPDHIDRFQLGHLFRCHREKTNDGPVDTGVQRCGKGGISRQDQIVIPDLLVDLIDGLRALHAVPNVEGVVESLFVIDEIIVRNIILLL